MPGRRHSASVTSSITAILSFVHASVAGVSSPSRAWRGRLNTRQAVTALNTRHLPVASSSGQWFASLPAAPRALHYDCQASCLRKGLPEQLPGRSS